MKLINILYFLSFLLIPLTIFLKLDCDILLYYSPLPSNYNSNNNYLTSNSNSNSHNNNNNNNNNNNTSKVIWILGASSGIGKELTLQLNNNNNNNTIIIITSRRLNYLLKLKEECKYQNQIEILSFDLFDYNKYEENYNIIINKYKKIDMIILNAGQSQRNSALNTSFNDTLTLMNLNYFSYVYITKLVLPDMIKNGGGQIVVMSSLSGKIGTPIGSSYSASKFALHGYFDALRAELADKNIKITIVCPGPVESDIHLHAIRAENTSALAEGRKMPTERFVQLMLKGLYYGFEEMWISEQPYLLFTYVSVYAPWIGRQINKFVGPKRVQALTSGENIFNMKELFSK